MNILKLYDYLYYRVYKLYLIKWNESMPWLYALGLVSIIQVFNLATLHFAYALLSGSYKIFARFGLMLTIGIIVFNYIRYHSRRYNYSSLSEKWAKENYEKEKSRGKILIVFIGLSFLVCLGMAILLGELNQGRL
ncbi:MAG: hypothetical protein PF448_02910 [Bacteroidales bacterium]|jgi:hypothetical protein|nr:hypothetical protein [Bacteroidales bacterium]